MKLGIGLIGGMGRGAFVGQLFNETGEAEVRVVYDINPSSFDVGRERFETAGVTPVCTTDFNDLLSRDDLDWIVVGTPDRTHYELARQVVEAGKNVFIEKPMTSTTAEADELCILARKHGVQVVVGCELRYSPSVETVHQALQDGRIGTPVSAVFIHQEARGYTYFLRNFRKRCWGGVLMQKGIHYLDMINGWAESVPTRVTATGSQGFFGHRPEAADRYCRDCAEAETCPFAFHTVPSPTWRRSGPREKGEHAFDHCVFMPDSDTEDNMHIHIDYASGLRVSYSAIYFAPINRKEVWIWGGRGSLHAVLDGPEPFVEITPFVGAMKERQSERLHIESFDGGHGGGDIRMIRAIVDASRATRPIRPDAVDGRHGVAVAEYAMKSIISGLPEKIPPPPPTL
ncbi:MAG: Gfo/Idh/MocA family oxidoreductase [Lentisphaeria bacterium]|nr:Gfo/Idh/MocA family oxidoreductase [Lentisphaeria bacterium]